MALLASTASPMTLAPNVRCGRMVLGDASSLVGMLNRAGGHSLSFVTTLSFNYVLHPSVLWCSPHSLISSKSCWALVHASQSSGFFFQVHHLPIRGLQLQGIFTGAKMKEKDDAEEELYT
jgi:hypothetical protein